MEDLLVKIVFFILFWIIEDVFELPEGRCKMKACVVADGGVLLLLNAPTQDANRYRCTYDSTNPLVT